jgi:hypothetical protein
VSYLHFRNAEGFRNFDFTLFSGREKVGTSAILRVKNEGEKIGHCLGILRKIPSTV